MRQPPSSKEFCGKLRTPFSLLWWLFIYLFTLTVSKYTTPSMAAETPVSMATPVKLWREELKCATTGFQLKHRCIKELRTRDVLFGK